MTNRQRLSSKPLAVSCFAAVLYLISTATPAETYGDAIEDGKSYGATVNSTMPDASTLPPESVPGYETAAPPEADHYGNPAGLSDAANQAAAQNEAAQSVTEGFVSRPMFTIEPETDPMFQRMDQVESNAATIAGALQGEYTSCEPVVLQTPNPPVTETCTESRYVENTSCKRTAECSVTGQEMRCEPKYFRCTPSASSCCNFKIECNSNGSVTVTYNDCCGHTYTTTGEDITAFYTPGIQYNWNSQSRLVCASNGACTVDFTNYYCSDPTHVLGFYPDVNQFSFDLDPIVECTFRNNCAELEARAR